MNENTENKPTEETQLLLPFEPPLKEAPTKPGAVDVDVLRAENEQLRTAVRLRDARDQIAGVLRAAGARSPRLLFESAKDSLQFGDDGSVQNAEAIVADLRRKFPEQFGDPRPSSIDGGAGAARVTLLTKEALAKMNPDEISHLDWDQVRQVLAS